MGFASEKQRRWAWANNPKMADDWAHGRSSVTGKKESQSEAKTHRGGTKNLPRYKSRKKTR